LFVERRGCCERASSRAVLSWLGGPEFPPSCGRLDGIRRRTHRSRWLPPVCARSSVPATPIPARAVNDAPRLLESVSASDIPPIHEYLAIRSNVKARHCERAPFEPGSLAALSDRQIAETSAQSIPPRTSSTTVLCPSNPVSTVLILGGGRRSARSVNDRDCGADHSRRTRARTKRSVYWARTVNRRSDIAGQAAFDPRPRT